MKTLLPIPMFIWLIIGLFIPHYVWIHKTGSIVTDRCQQAFIEYINSEKENRSMRAFEESTWCNYILEFKDYIERS